MKRFAILCTSLAILASVPSNSFAQNFPNSSSLTNLQKLNNAVGSSKSSAIGTKTTNMQNSSGTNTFNTVEETDKDKTQLEKIQQAFSKNDDKLNDPSYVKNRIQELERALYNRTKKEIITNKPTKESNTQIVEQTLEEEYKEKQLEREIKEKIENESNLKNFGRDFFENGTNMDTSLFADSAPSDYELGPGDSLKIIIWSELGDETVYDVQVNPEGQVYIPIIGILGVSGKTVGQFESIVLGKLSGKFNHFKGQVTLSKVKTIMIFVAGEVEKPGAMMVSGLTTAFSALYHAGGPTDKGSMRNIKVIEANGNSKNIDLYKYFLSGDRKQDIPIKNGDTVFVPITEKRVTVSGMVTRPAIYEVTGDTVISEVIKMSGNILPEAYAGRILVTRWTGNERRKSFDVDPSDTNAMNSFIVKPGDEIKVERSNGIVENKVTISGPVHKPGDYSANSGITVSGLIKLAGGIVKETANYSHGQIIRKTSGGKDEIISFDLRKALEGDPQEDKALKPLDEIKLFEEKEITNEVLKVYVGGAVRTTGVFDYHDGMKLSDLVLLANGLKNDASGDAEIARKTEGDTSVIIKANIKKALEDKNSPDNVTLQALDKVNIIAKGDYLFEPEVVVLKGQVKKPGAYALTHRGERLSSLIKRAGGLTDRAFPEGTVFMRNISNISSSSQVETAVSVQDDLFRKANLDLRAELIKAGAKDVDMQNLSNDIRGDGVTKQMMDKAGLVSENSIATNTVSAKNNDVFKALESQNGDNSENATVKTRIAIPMIKILSERVSENDDIELMDGDEITVPVIPHTVSVLGAVMNPTTIMFNKNGNASYYIDRAGGYSRNSDHRRTVVVRANGEVMRLRNVRKIGRGDIILVPPKAGIVKKDIYKEVGTIAQILGNLAVTYKVVRDDD